MRKGGLREISFLESRQRENKDSRGSFQEAVMYEREVSGPEEELQMQSKFTGDKSAGKRGRENTKRKRGSKGSLQ